MLKKRSVPSLIAGLGLALAFGSSSYLIMQQKHFQGHTLAGISSVVLLGAGLHRYTKAPKSMIPISLIVLGLFSSYYQLNKAWEWKDSV
ncbi:hypothetical protein ABK040_001943 [Willaertia magna]